MLVTLTERPNPPALDLIRERALPALVEMARWKTLRYALPSYLLPAPTPRYKTSWDHGEGRSRSRIRGPPQHR
jgi:hypothetical protein